MARLFLGLAVVGFVVPNTVTLIESVHTAFALDLLATAVAVLIWMTIEAARLGIRRIWIFWVLTLLFGMGGTLPLFFYLRERRLAAGPA